MLGKLVFLGITAGLLTAFGRTGLTAFESLINMVKYSLTGSELNAIDMALQRHHIMMETGSRRGSYPAEADFQSFMKENFTSRTGRKVWQDHWGTDLIYTNISRRREDGFEIRSCGADRTAHTEADVYLARVGEKVTRELGPDINRFLDALGHP